MQCSRVLHFLLLAQGFQQRHKLHHLTSTQYRLHKQHKLAILFKLVSNVVSVVTEVALKEEVSNVDTAAVLKVIAAALTEAITDQADLTAMAAFITKVSSELTLKGMDILAAG